MISVEKVKKCNKLNKLLEILIKIDNEQYREGTVIFVNDNQTADFLASFVSETICPAVSVHGDRLEYLVTDALQQYESRDMPILIATSVEANVGCNHLINFDIPKNVEEYEQRIRRTNQIGQKPNIYTLFSESIETMGKVFDRIVKAAAL